MSNKLFEFGSKVNVILSFVAPVTINNVEYSVGEPYLFLREVELVINYANLDKSGSQGKADVIANSDVGPQSIQLGGVPLTKKLISLLTTSTGTTNFNKTVFETGIAFSGVIYMTNQDAKLNFNVYDNDLNKISDVVYDEANNSISSINFNESEEYIISFSSVKNGSGYSLEKTHFPYMRMEIQGKGNVDKDTKEIILVFDKVSMNSIVQFNFIQDSVLKIPLEFRVIKSDYNMYIEE